MLDDKARWEIARGIIQHEDTLTNHRLTWLVTIEGFVFAAVGFCLKALIESERSASKPALWLIVLVLAVLGAVFPALMHIPIERAARQVFEVKDWWDEKRANFPAIVGSRDGAGLFFGVKDWSLQTLTLPRLFVALWTIFGIVAAAELVVSLKAARVGGRVDSAVTVPAGSTDAGVDAVTPLSEARAHPTASSDRRGVPSGLPPPTPSP